MHIMITRRCNMTCKHCCYACNTKGEDMSAEIFYKAIDIAVKMKHRIALAGGEPTIHPQFMDFLAMAISKSNDVYIHTNGKEKVKSLFLAKLAEKGIIIAGISQDQWHEPIDDEVIRAFRVKEYNENDKRFIRDVSLSKNAPQKAGRCDWGTDKYCSMYGTCFVDVDGKIYECGCENAKSIGHVSNTVDFIKKYNLHKWGCYNGLKNPE